MLASAILSPTFVVFPFCLAVLFLFLIWFSYCFSISSEFGTYHPSIVTAFQLADVYTCLMICFVWIIEQLGEFVYPAIVIAVLLSVHCLWNEAIKSLQIELYQLMFLCNLFGVWLYVPSYCMRSVVLNESVIYIKKKKKEHTEVMFASKTGSQKEEFLNCH